MRKIIQFILKKLSQAILKKYKPDIIGITGSVGKTSAKQAIYSLLRDSFNVRASYKNYNTEIGVPLNIIGSTNPGHSIFGWLKVIYQGLHLAFLPQKAYPKILILEMAADHPGDIKYLVSFARPKIGLITSVGPTHLEFFGSQRKVADEKANMINSLPADAYAIIMNDQKILVELSKRTKAQVMTYGLKQAEVTASQIKLDTSKGGLSFHLKYKDSDEYVELPHLLGRPGIYSLLAATAVGLCYNLSLPYIAKKLKNYQALPGRLNLLPGIKYTKIIDDSYNSSPQAAEAALEVLSQLKCTGEKFAVIGDMLELGDYTKPAHQQLGTHLAKLAIDYLITVGQRSLAVAQAAKEYGMNPDRIFNFDNSQDAANFMQDRIKQGDLILVKGSAAVHMERIVKEIMAEPDRAHELLVRQD